MKNENCSSHLAFFGKRKCTNTDFFKTEITEDIEKERTMNQVREIDGNNKLNFHLIDIDKVFAN